MTQPANKQTAQKFAEDFPGKLFYFCLRKTGDQGQAEDLAAEIAVSVLTQLKKGARPAHFHAWVWAIAKRQTAAWTMGTAAAQKRAAPEGPALAELPAVPEEETDENVFLLRRELAFAVKAHREILVAYYMENQSVRHIAKALGCSEGTVMSRLFRCRQQLKEGLGMTREFGVRSYRPEHITFVKNGSDGTDGSPWKQVGTKLNKNILLEAYNNPSTLEQLALALGVAAPYMEEAVDELTTVELLVKRGETYETNFLILSRQAQERMQQTRLEIAPKLFETLRAIVQIIEDEQDQTGRVLLGGYQDWETLRWFLLLWLVDHAFFMMMPENPYSSGSDFPPPRPRGGKWELIGYEDFPREVFFVGLHGTGPETSMHFMDYKIQTAGLESRMGGDLMGEQAQTLEKFLKNGVAACDPDILETLAKRGYLYKKNVGFVPAMAVGRQNRGDLLPDLVSADANAAQVKPLLTKAASLWDNLRQATAQAVSGEIPALLAERVQNHPYYYMSFEAEIRGHMIQIGLETGFLKLPADVSKSTVALAALL